VRSLWHRTGGHADCVCGGAQNVHVPLLVVEDEVWEWGVQSGVVIGQDEGVIDIVVVEPDMDPEVVLMQELG
jgi:hypothetical protein